MSEGVIKKTAALYLVESEMLTRQRKPRLAGAFQQVEGCVCQDGSGQRMFEGKADGLIQSLVGLGQQLLGSDPLLLAGGHQKSDRRRV